MTRFDSIDLLRGTAILGMILCHFVLFTTPEDGSYRAIQFFAGNILGFWPAPLFTLLAGMSLGISLDRQRAAGRTFLQIGRRTLLRAFVVFTIGVLFRFRFGVFIGPSTGTSCL